MGAKTFGKSWSGGSGSGLLVIQNYRQAEAVALPGLSL